MLKTTSAALLLLAVAAPGFAQCRFPRENSGRLLSYAFDPAVTGDGTILHVTLSFQGGQDARDEVEIPTEWAGEKLHGLVNLRALSKDTVVADGNSPGTSLTGSFAESATRSRLRR
ncbi:MAG TPA: hypothetical protein VG273_11665 [Bryobacteraceae bacterium]|nr:hypothetical protein [Bryobacteraceae bacterium]